MPERVFLNFCYGDLNRFGGTDDEFRPCYDCEWWGYSDKAPDWVKRHPEYELIMADTDRNDT